MLSEEAAERSAIRFDISPEDIIHTAEYAITRERQFLDTIAQVEKPAFDSVIVPLKEADNKCNTEYRICGFLQYVSSDKDVRDASAKAMALAYDCKAKYLERDDVYKAVRAVYDNDKEMSGLEVDDRILVEKMELKFRRSGLLLSENKRNHLAKLEARLNELTYLFNCNIDNMEQQVLFTRKELEGLSDNFFCRLETKQVNDETKYIVTTTYCDYHPVMKYAVNEDTRKALYAVKEKECSDNISILAEAVQIRSEKARLLGYATFSEYILEIQSINTPEAALEILESLRGKLTILAKKELYEIEALKRSDMKTVKLPYKGVFEWDIEYYMHKVATAKSGIKENFCEYFAIDTVLPRMLSFFQELFGISITHVNNLNVWNPDVIALEVWESDKQTFVGNLYLDLYARDGKTIQAALFPLCHGNRRRDGTRVHSAMALILNYSKSSTLDATLLKHSDICILMSMLGQVIYNTCSTKEWSELYIESRDISSEAIAQMSEHFAWEPSFLRRIAVHHQSSKPIPDDILEALVSNKNVESGLNNLRQLFYGMYDLSIHNSTKDNVNIQKVYNDMAKDIALVNNGDVVTYGAATFSHVMADYESTYFEYLQAAIYGADLFLKHIHRDGTGSIEASAEFGPNILRLANDSDQMKNMTNFFGRNPNSEAFFKLLG